MSLLSIYKPPMNCQAPNHHRISCCLVSCHSLHDCSQKHTRYWKICDSHHSPLLACPGNTVWLEGANGIFCSFFHFCYSPFLQFCHWLEVPLDRPESLVEIPKEKFCETFPPPALDKCSKCIRTFSSQKFGVCYFIGPEWKCTKSVRVLVPTSLAT